MNVNDAIKRGDLAEALSAAKVAVRDDPASAAPRILLFQLLCVVGDWSRALTQLNVLGDLDNKTLAMVQTYRELLQCEALRAEVFAGKRRPGVFGEPEAWVAQVVAALETGVEHGEDKAQEQRLAAFADAPATSGSVDGTAFEWIADADSRIGPFLEVILTGRYTWVPFHLLRKVTFEAPEDLRDLVWAPVHLTFTNGGSTVAFVPTRYPGSHASTDSAIALSRRTDWEDKGANSFHGLGQRILATDTGDLAVLDCREINLEPRSAQ
jgi:type VI secretion system protein ImpE